MTGATRLLTTSALAFAAAIVSSCETAVALDGEGRAQQPGRRPPRAAATERPSALRLDEIGAQRDPYEGSWESGGAAAPSRSRRAEMFHRPPGAMEEPGAGELEAPAGWSGQVETPPRRSIETAAGRETPAGVASAPERRDPSARPAGARTAAARPPLPEARTATPAEHGTARSESVARREGPEGIDGEPATSLIDELHRLLQRRWHQAQWSRDAATESDRRELELALVALAFLRPSEEARELPRAALDAILENGDVESRLLAAAFLERAGLGEERDALIDEVCARRGEPAPNAAAAAADARLPDLDRDAADPRDEAGAAAERGAAPTPSTDRSAAPEALQRSMERAIARGAEASSRSSPPPDAERAPGAANSPPPPGGGGFLPETDAPVASSFRLKDVAFVTGISDMGRYAKRDANVFNPSEKALIYGEFTGHRERVEQGRDAPVFVRRFTGTLALTDASGAVIDSGVFLSAEKGVSRGPARRETINFWAEYTFPADLEPGDYRLRIRAMDLEAGEEATEDLAVTIARGEE